MYRVKLAPGEERQLESKQEFQDATARGTIGPAALVHMGGAWVLARNHPDYVPVDPTLAPLPAPAPAPVTTQAPPPPRPPAPPTRAPGRSALSAHPILSDDGVPLLERSRPFDLPPVAPPPPPPPQRELAATAEFIDVSPAAATEPETSVKRPDARSNEDRVVRRTPVLGTVRRVVGWALVAAAAGGIGYAGWRYVPDLWYDATRLARDARPRALPADTLPDSLSADTLGASAIDSSSATPVAVPAAPGPTDSGSDAVASDAVPSAPAAARPDSSAAAPGPARPTTLIGHFALNMDSLRIGLHEELTNVGFAGVMRPGRVGTIRHLRNGRQSVAAARNIIRLYRRDSRLLEHTYLDTLTGFQPERLDGAAAHEWEQRRVRPEPYVVTTVADSMLATIDSAFAFLAERPGRYRLVKAGGLDFDDFEDAKRYERFFARIRYLRQLGVANAPPGAPPVTVLEAVRAIE